MRLFIATRLAEDVAGKLTRGFSAFRSRAARASWVSGSAYHLTYAFIGEQNESVAKHVGEQLAAALSGVPPYVGALSGGGFFPGSRRPRVGWIALEQPEKLMAVADSVRRMLDRLAVPYDGKAFRPHLTVVRIRDGWPASDVAGFVHACDELGRIEIVLDRVSLFRSELRPQGARHEELAAVDLA